MVVEALRTISQPRIVMETQVHATVSQPLRVALALAGVADVVLGHFATYPQCVTASRTAYWESKGIDGGLQTHYMNLIDLMTNVTASAKPQGAMRKMKLGIVRSSGFLSLLFTFADQRRLFEGSSSIWYALFPSFVTLLINVCTDPSEKSPTVKDVLLEQAGARAGISALCAYGLTARQDWHDVGSALSGENATGIIVANNSMGIHSKCLRVMGLMFAFIKQPFGSPLSLHDRRSVHLLLNCPGSASACAPGRSGGK